MSLTIPTYNPHDPALYAANVSGPIPGQEFPFRVFYYAPGMGFETNRSVYVGRNECRTKEEAQALADNWTRTHRSIVPA